MADITITDNAHATVEISKSDLLTLTDLLKQNEEVVCLTYGVHVLALVVSMELLKTEPLGTKIAKVTKGY